MQIMCILDIYIANYWPGMNNTAFLVRVNKDHFDNIFKIKRFKNTNEKLLRF